jgi:anti-anti-sigma regulatory factor
MPFSSAVHGNAVEICIDGVYGLDTLKRLEPLLESGLEYAAVVIDWTEVHCANDAAVVQTASVCHRLDPKQTKIFHYGFVEEVWRKIKKLDLQGAFKETSNKESMLKKFGQ